MKRKKIDLIRILTLALVVLVPGAVQAGVANSFALPDTGYISNVVIDIIEHNGGVWFATSEGINFSFDDGETWLSYDDSNGLVSSSVSALYSIPNGGTNRLWAGTNHEEEVIGVLATISDGVSYSDDNGNEWTQIIFDESGLDIPWVWGGDRSVFDIAGHFDENDADDDWLFFTAFAGGLLASRDAGITWRRIYSSVADSVQFFFGSQPSLRNRYFSCATDTSHGDTLFLFGGTAEGFFQYVYSVPREKMYTQHVSDIALCDNCPAEDSNFVYFGGDVGLTRGLKTGEPFITRFESDGLPGQSIVSLVDFGGILFAGTVDPTDSSSTGLAESSDFGESFAASATFPATGLNNRILDFAVMSDRLYVATEEAGLYVTDDVGTTWDHIFVDSSDMTAANRRNVVHALKAWGDTLLVGTDSGLVSLFMDVAGVIDSSRFFVFTEGDSSAAKVVRIETQTYLSNDVIWTANRPLTISGTPMVGRSADFGDTFVPMQVGVISHDFDFFGDTAFVVGQEGIRFATGEGNPSNIYDLREITGEGVVDSLIADTITMMEVLGDTVFVGSQNGFAVSYNRGDSWDIRRANRDTLRADMVFQYTSSISGISGDFVPAIDVQYLPDTLARVWVSCRPAYSGTTGITVGRIDRAWREIIDTSGAVIDSEFVDIYNWDDVYDDYAWNFTFYGDTVFAATDGGLIFAEGDNLLTGDLTWDTLALVDSTGASLVFDGTPVYAVEIIGDYIWVGTGDRTVRIRLDNFEDQRPLFVVDSADEAYAFPVPYSHSLNQAIEFHFTVDEDANITLEIYDFAMNLVRRVIDQQFYPAGIYPTAGIGRQTWDGLNGEGDRVAVGVYYFKIEYSTGEVRWGKLAVIP